MPGSILLVTPTYPPFISGNSTQVAELAKRFAADGGEVSVLTTNARHAEDFWLPSTYPRPRLPDPVPSGGVNVYRATITYPWPAPLASGVLRRAAYLLGRLPLETSVLRRLSLFMSRTVSPLQGMQTALKSLTLSADLVHAFDSSRDWLFVSAEKMASRFGRPFVCTPLMHLGDTDARSHFQMAHQVHAYRRAAAVLALSRAEMEAFVKLGVPRSRVQTIAMGVSAFGVNSAQVANQFRAQFGLNGPIVAFIGANTYDKGAHTLARAVAELNRTGELTNLVMIGPGCDRFLSFLDNEPAGIRQTLKGHMLVLGVVDEETKHAVLSAAEMLALPSRVDTFGIVVLEAWAHGKPVIGARAGGIPDLIHEGETGLLVPFGDTLALSAAIRRLLKEKSLAKRLGKVGQETVLRNYSWDQTYQEIKRVYTSLFSSDTAEH